MKDNQISENQNSNSKDNHNDSINSNDLVDSFKSINSYDSIKSHDSIVSFKSLEYNESNKISIEESNNFQIESSKFIEEPKPDMQNKITTEDENNQYYRSKKYHYTSNISNYYYPFYLNFYKKCNKLCVNVNVKDIKQNNFSFISNTLKMQEGINDTFVLELCKIGNINCQNIAFSELSIELNNLDENDSIVLEYEHSTYSLSNYLNLSSHLLTVYDKLIILASLALGIKEIHNNNLVHGSISINCAFNTDKMWKVAGIFKYDLNDKYDNNNKLNKYFPVNNDSICLGIDIYDFGLLFYELLTGYKLNTNDDGILESENCPSKVKNSYYDQLNNVLNHHLMFFTKLNRKSFKKYTFRILKNSLRSNTKKRYNIEQVINSLLDLLELYN